MMDWRPIETAPKDGTRVLISLPDWPLRELHRRLDGSYQRGRAVIEARWDGHAWGDPVYWEWRVDVRGAQPTHWMPLPPPAE